MNNNLGRALLLCISFIEGGSVMGFEVLSAKIYTPYLGASIYVWTSILTVTLIGLATGYWLGGKWSLINPKRYLLLSLLGAGITVLLSTFIADATLPSLLHQDVRTASILGGFLILFLPVFFLGTVSPLIISILNPMTNNLSSATGLIYGVGTLGGLLFLLLTVFFLIPEIGVKSTSYVIGCGPLVLAGLTTLINVTNEEK